MCSISVPLVTLPLSLPANSDPNSVRFFVTISATWVTASVAVVVVVVTGGVGDGGVILDNVVDEASSTISVDVDELLSDIVVGC